MNRSELDALAEHYRLDERGVAQLLELAGARPSRTETARFAARALLLGGTLSLAAGVVFFVAANWGALRILGRFALLELLFVGAVALAFWKPPPRAAGRYALLAAFLLTGALLALFGQTYQTGADVYELFLTWALLGVPLVIGGQWGVTWAAWVLVLNVALGLYAGWQPQGGALGIVLSPLLAPAIVNLLLWTVCEASRRGHSMRALAPLSPLWLGRFVLTCALGFATWAGAVAIVADPPGAPAPVASYALTLLLVGGMLAGIGAYACRQRRDVFPIALIVASLIVLGTVGVARHSGLDDVAMFFALAAWLVVSSTILGRVLMHLVRTWRGEAASA